MKPAVPSKLNLKLEPADAVTVDMEETLKSNKKDITQKKPPSVKSWGSQLAFIFSSLKQFNQACFFNIFKFFRRFCILFFNVFKIFERFKFFRRFCIFQTLFKSRIADARCALVDELKTMTYEETEAFSQTNRFILK